MGSEVLIALDSNSCRTICCLLVSKALRQRHCPIQRMRKVPFSQDKPPTWQNDCLLTMVVRSWLSTRRVRSWMSSIHNIWALSNSARFTVPSSTGLDTIRHLFPCLVNRKTPPNPRIRSNSSLQLVTCEHPSMRPPVSRGNSLSFSIRAVWPIVPSSRLPFITDKEVGTSGVSAHRFTFSSVAANSPLLVAR